MSFLEPRKPNRPHICPKPSTSYPEGTRWQCDECAAIYCLEDIRDRGVSEIYWKREGSL